MVSLNLDTAIKGIEEQVCPYCHSSLFYDVQADSIYVSCSCGNFNVSTFRDKYNGSLLLYYLNNSDEGSISGENLKQLQNVLYRNKRVKRELFSIKLKQQIL
ncbi:MAG: hypothetical protein GF364_18660 [Candidatus Lokiarchaeota archaeon]|nr:hypothetical protein [Candidatus Lokiarchaeota archaeon]